jgi:hypothetical protein
MKHLLCLAGLIVVSAILVVSGFSRTIVESAAQDPPPDIDNQWVRVFRESLPPHVQSATRQHPATVVVYLSDAHERLLRRDGSAKDVRRKHGEVTYVEAGAYAVENASNTTINAVVIELKDQSGRPTSAPLTLDPVKLDAKHHPVLLDNERVRVLHTILVPHRKSPLHEHPHYVVVYLTELHTTQALPDGRLIDNPRVAGEIAWKDATTHVTENVGERTAEEIQVELK